MATWQMIILLAITGCTIGCLIGIYKAVERMSKAVFTVGAELKKMNAKLERIEAVSKDDAARPVTAYGVDDSIEAALRNLDKL
jgi:hypothetical protein